MDEFLRGKSVQLLAYQRWLSITGCSLAIAIVAMSSSAAHTGHPHGEAADPVAPNPTAEPAVSEPQADPTLSINHSAMKHPYKQVVMPALKAAAMVRLTPLATPLSPTVAGVRTAGSGLQELAFFWVIGSPLLLYAARQRWATHS